MTLEEVLADSAYLTQFHMIIVALPETFMHRAKLPYLYPGESLHILLHSNLVTQCHMQCHLLPA
jgi:hypothetical protein